MIKALARAAAVAVFLAGSVAHAQLATFDDYLDGCTSTTFDELINTSYKEFAWTNFYIGNGAYTTTKNSTPGYVNGVVTPGCISFNGFGGNASLSSTSDFSFNGGYFTSAFFNDNVLRIAGLNSSNVEMFSTSLTLTTTGPQLLNVNWTGIRSVEFSSSNFQFVFDNFRFNDTVDPTIPPTTVPEPSTVALMGAGLFAVLVASRRRA